jgi:glycerol-3-phosphate dehydrogenase (NAD(P)+)
MQDSQTPARRPSIGVIGAGAWGTALAQLAASSGDSVSLWALEPETAAAINRTRENPAFLPGFALRPEIQATTDLAETAAADILLLVTPAQYVRGTLRKLKPALRPGQLVALCAKGVEQGSLALMSEIHAQEVPETLAAVQSGPGFARDVVRGLPTAVTIACAEEGPVRALAEALGGKTFRPYLSDDLIGAEVGGAVKNVIAIACGVADGRGMGDGARAALITRGFAELRRLGLALGGRAETLSGLCGLGDLVLTCSSRTSRNMSLGAALGEGRTAAEVLAERKSVAEGVASAPAVAALAAKVGVEMPLCAAVDDVLSGRVSLDSAIDGLLSRPFRAEGD